MTRAWPYGAVRRAPCPRDDRLLLYARGGRQNGRIAPPLVLFRRDEPVDVVFIAGKYLVLVGSDQGKVDLMIKHPTLSAAHASFHYEPGIGCVICDLWSAHGTYIDNDRLMAPGHSQKHTDRGRPFQPTVWRPGQRVKFGRYIDEWVLANPACPAITT
eukprot:gene25407-42176_t